MIAFFISQKLQKEPIYEALSHQEGIHLPTAETRIQSERIQVQQAMRLQPITFSPDAEAQAILGQMQTGGFDAWPVVAADGLRGMLRNYDVEQAVAKGGAHKTVAEILESESKDHEMPHVHPDHSLSLAMERMGRTGLNVLPVVSRANAHQLVGIVALRDILNTYGVAKRDDASPNGAD